MSHYKIQVSNNPYSFDMIDKALLFCTVVMIGNDEYTLVRPKIWNHNGSDLTHGALVDKIMKASEERGSVVEMYYPTFYDSRILSGILLEFLHLISNAQESAFAAAGDEFPGLEETLEKQYDAANSLLSILRRER